MGQAAHLVRGVEVHGRSAAASAVRAFPFCLRRKEATATSLITQPAHTEGAPKAPLRSKSPRGKVLIHFAVMFCGQ